MPSLYSKIEVLEDIPNLAFYVIFEIAVPDSRDSHLADLRNINSSRRINNHAQIRLDLTPDPDTQLIAWTNHVFSRRLGTINRGEGAWRFLK
jgi:hypothetical protein